MNRVAAVVALLVAVGSARAQPVGPGRLVAAPVRVTVTAAGDPPGVELFVVGAGRVDRLTSAKPVVLWSDAATPIVAFTVFAVPTAAAGQFPGAPPSADWFRRRNNPDAIRLGGGRVRARPVLFDDRDLVAEDYRVEPGADGWRLVLMSSNALPVVSAVTWGLLGIVAPLGVWAGWRINRPGRPEAPDPTRIRREEPAC
ncbi:MAG TPA: hypothetical protein VH092_01655 [Urbifossiella sp.]|jgi:hypothetical protein|nr:hypothetical protein [Urbifossiella sp.]